jgi:hypothetical protein
MYSVWSFFMPEVKLKRSQPLEKTPLGYWRRLHNYVIIFALYSHARRKTQYL